MDKQQLLLVDNEDNFSGTYALRKDCHMGNGLHHRAFVVCLFNSKDQILLQKRKHRLWDGFWDVTAISHPLHLTSHDESYHEAAGRALQAEMGISGVALHIVGGFNYYVKFGKYCENEYCAILQGDYSGDVFPATDLVYTYQWMDRQVFVDDCKKNSAQYTPWAVLTASFLTVKES